jgi:hypothetical protein
MVAWLARDISYLLAHGHGATGICTAELWWHKPSTMIFVRIPYSVLKLISLILLLQNFHVSIRHLQRPKQVRILFTFNIFCNFFFNSDGHFIISWYHLTKNFILPLSSLVLIKFYDGKLRSYLCCEARSFHEG